MNITKKLKEAFLAKLKELRNQLDMPQLKNMQEKKWIFLKKHFEHETNQEDILYTVYTKRLKEEKQLEFEKNDNII